MSEGRELAGFREVLVGCWERVGNACLGDSIFCLWLERRATRAHEVEGRGTAGSDIGRVRPGPCTGFV